MTVNERPGLEALRLRFEQVLDAHRRDEMRMPERLQYVMTVDPLALKVRCPPTTPLTLVENAVRHGIDPSEEGGRIDVDIKRVGSCCGRVRDCSRAIACQGYFAGIAKQPLATMGPPLNTRR